MSGSRTAREQDTAPAGTTRAVDRALAVLHLVCDCPNLGLTDIAARCGLPISSTLRVLRTLCASGHVSRGENGLYVAGPEMVWLSGRVLANDSLRHACRPGMRALAAQTDESIYLSVRHEDRALYLDVAVGSHGIENPSWEGREIPLESTAAGQCLTGSLGEATSAVVTAGVERGMTAIAAPIDLDARPVAALSMVLPTVRLDLDRVRRYQDLIAAAADEMSVALSSESPFDRPSRSIEAARRRATLPVDP